MTHNPNQTASLYVTDHAGNQAFHAYQINWGPQWHYTATGYSGVLIASGEADLARSIATIVHSLPYGWSFHAQWYVMGERDGMASSKVFDAYPDSMYGIVHEDKYLGWAEWIRLAIPKETPPYLDRNDTSMVESAIA